ncbi:SseB family protein [Marimonas arenosa]|uniref:SseB family protein n=1 Tax=Marimonas arenosa TaxID=1795305 RepID=A0AAE3WGW1_9RHOB|nr:SseB family protein [Marimonas arenosa]MDQ2092175.1 SseB family protein [Marimonas arenosa]
MSETPLDMAHGAMTAAPDNDAERLRFYDALADATLFLLLECEPEGEAVEPRTLEVEGATFVLAFDSEERLVDFAAQTAPYAALSGRALAGMLSGQALGLGLNLDVAPSSVLLPAAAMDWLAQMLETSPDEDRAGVRALVPPDLPETLVTALEAKLARAGGLARQAWLVGARYVDGRAGHLLAVLDATPGAQAALAKAVGEALVFSGAEAGTLDVTFWPEDSMIAARLADVGLRFDLPVPEAEDAVQVPGAAPGMDPSKPPKLK